MSRVLIHGTKLAKPLNRRRPVTIELPEFLIRAIDLRVAEANRNEPADDEVSFNDVVEWLLACELTVRRMPFLEAGIPGFAAAMAMWLIESNYQPEEED